MDTAIYARMLAELKKIDPEWETITDTDAYAGLCRHYKFFTVRLVSNPYRRQGGTMLLYATPRIEPYWDKDIIDMSFIQPRGHNRIKAYRRTFTGSEPAKAKDVMAAVRRFLKNKEEIGNYTAGYMHEAEMQGELYALREQLQVDSSGNDAMQLTRQSRGFSVYLFATNDAQVRLSIGRRKTIHLSLGGHGERGAVLQRAADTIADHSLFEKRGYILRECRNNVETRMMFSDTSGNKYRSQNTLEYELPDGASFTDHLQIVKESYLGRQIIQRFMLEKMGKK